MIKSPQGSLYSILVAAFTVLVVISNIISAKIVQFPLGNINLPAGLITYPLTFLLSDLVTEIYGARNSKSMVYIAFGMNLLAFAIIELALLLPAASAFDSDPFQVVLGLSGLRVFASLVGYLFSQILDIQLYAWIRSWTGIDYLWLRNNGSSLISQLVDTVLVDLIYLCWGLEMPWQVVFPIMTLSYLYKSLFSMAGTPFLYLCLHLYAKYSQNLREDSEITIS